MEEKSFDEPSANQTKNLHAINTSNNIAQKLSTVHQHVLDQAKEEDRNKEDFRRASEARRKS